MSQPHSSAQGLPGATAGSAELWWLLTYGMNGFLSLWSRYLLWRLVRPHWVPSFWYQMQTLQKRLIFTETLRSKTWEGLVMGSSPGSLAWPGTSPGVLILPIIIRPHFPVNTMAEWLLVSSVMAGDLPRVPWDPWDHPFTCWVCPSGITHTCQGIGLLLPNNLFRTNSSLSGAQSSKVGVGGVGGWEWGGGCHLSLGHARLTAGETLVSPSVSEWCPQIGTGWPCARHPLFPQAPPSNGGAISLRPPTRSEQTPYAQGYRADKDKRD